MELSPTIGALAQCRQTVLRRAHELIGGDGDTAVAPETLADATPGVAGLLMASLEELKVAEEELREQNALLAAGRAHEDHERFHYQQLFLLAPAPALVTDRYATILEANIAASTLFRREAQHLARKPMGALLHPAERERFRTQLSRVQSDSRITDWRLVLNRVGDVPIEVRAAVSFIMGLGPTGAGLLYWMLTPV
jgi:PAS domain-containing protein